MIKIIRVTNGITLDYLKPFLITGEDYEDVESLVGSLKEVLSTDPNFTYFSVAVEEEVILGFILAIGVPAKSVTRIFQAWFADDPRSEKLKDTLFLRLLLWSEQNELLFTRIDTHRTSKTLITYWKFEDFFEIKTLDVTKNLEDTLMSKKKGDENVLPNG